MIEPLIPISNVEVTDAISTDVSNLFSEINASYHQVSQVLESGSVSELSSQDFGDVLVTLSEVKSKISVASEIRDSLVESYQTLIKV